jgi:hypothetical protein
MNIIFSLIFLYCLNHLQFKFDLNKNAWNKINCLNIGKNEKCNLNIEHHMLYV